MTDISSLPRWQRFDEVQRKKAQKHLVYSAGTAGLAAAGMGAARWGAENAGGVLRRRGRVPAPVLGRVARAVRGPRFGRVMGGTAAAAGLLGAGSTLTWGASLGREIKRDEAKLRAQNLSKAVGLVDVSKREWNVGRRSSKGSIGVFTDDQYNKISDSAVALDRQRHGRRVKSNAMFYGGLGAAAGGAIGSKSRRVGRGALIGAVGGAGFGAGMGALSNAMRPARIRTQMQRPKMRRQVETQAYMNRVLAQQQQKVGKADDWRAHVSPGALEGYRYLKRGERDKKALAAVPVGTAVGGLGLAAAQGVTGYRHLRRYGSESELWDLEKPKNVVPRRFPVARARLRAAGGAARWAAPAAVVGAAGLALAPSARRQWAEANRWRDKAGKIQARGEQRRADAGQDFMLHKSYRSWVERKRADAVWERRYVRETGDAPVGKALPPVRFRRLAAPIRRGSAVRRGTFVRTPVGQTTYRRGSL